MTRYFAYQNRFGPFYIVENRDGWSLVFGDGEEFDGPHDNPYDALEVLVSGACSWPSCGDPSEMDLPDDLSEWQFMEDM